MSVTIRDVSKKAGVSPATVSLVLNGRSGISETTRLRVLETAEKMGYQIPSRKVQKKNGKIIRFLKIARHGHIINRNHNVFIADYIDGLEKEAWKYGFSLEVRNYKGFDSKIILEDLNNSPPAGMVVLATELRERDISSFQKITIPMVFIDASHPSSPFDFVDMDNAGALFSIISAFKDRGHSQIGLVKANVETRNFYLRKNNFYQAMDYFGLSTDEKWIYTVDSTYGNAYLDMKKQLEENRKLPTALFCVCDMIAFGCMKALKEKGLHIPGDLSLIGFDDLPSGQMTEPPLASVKVSKTRIGRRAFQLLKRRMDNGKDLPYEKVFIGGELIIRQSLGDAPINRRYV